MVRSSRRLLAGVLAAGTLLAASSSLAPASAASDPYPGLFGSSDPTYDGVFRQSLALLSFVAAGQEPPAEAVEWLLWQQCDDGGFQAFRADVTAPCVESDPVNYTGEDTNSTGLAATALLLLDEVNAADAALGWLEDAQNSDGGFPYFVGGESDANSTATVLVATNTVGLSPSQVTHSSGTSAADYLISLQVGCAGAAADEDGAFAYNASWGAGYANDAATAQAAFALTGAPLPFVGGTPSTDVPRADCPAPGSAAPTEEPAPTATQAAPSESPAVDPSPDAEASPEETATPEETVTPEETTSAEGAEEAATGGTVQEARAAAPLALDPGSAELAGGYLARLIDTYGGAVPQLDFSTGQRKPGTVSPGDTAWAVLALSAIGVGADQRDAALATLLDAAADDPANPGLLALAALAVTAADGDGDEATVSALVDSISATLQQGSETPVPTPTGDPEDALSPTGAAPATPWLAATGTLLLVGGALALATTRRRGARA